MLVVEFHYYTTDIAEADEAGVLVRWPVLQVYEVIQPKHEIKGGLPASIPHISGL